MTQLFAVLTFFWNHRPETLAVALLAVAGLGLISRVPVAYSAMNLVVRWWTVSLTIFAFVLVIGLLIVMLAFVNGMYALTKTSGQPGNVIILADGATDESFSNLAITDVSDIANQPGIVRVDNAPLVSRETYVIVNQPIIDGAEGRPKRRFLQVRGVDNPEISATVHGLKLMPESRWFSDAGVGPLPGAPIDAAPAVEIVLGNGIARELGLDRKPEVRAKAKDAERLVPGDTFALNNRTWLVVGVLESSGGTYDSEVWGKQSLLGPMFGKDNYSTLVIRTKDAATAEQMRDFFANKDDKGYTKAKLNAIVETKYFEGLSQTNVQFLIGAVIVAVFTAVGGIFGVMNTMFAAISQRTRDIGVLRLLGFRRSQILVSFLLESMLLAIIGGALGCAIGCFADGWTANSIVSGGPGGGGGKFVVLKMQVDAAVLSTGMLLALTMGFFGGLIPSISAMRLTALDALR
ncbi:FtsX-like permease family protein [bacterium]|nr:FtsX-like permease family protein [bacterium]